MAAATTRARAAHGRIVTYSPKVFIPLTKLCRDVCHYCSFAIVPRPGQRAYLTPDEVRTIARDGQAVGCGEALFTLGEAPEERYAVARAELAELGYASTNAYCAAMAEMVQREFGLVAHINAGVMPEEDIAAFRRVSGSQGMMLETVSDRLSERGQAHFGSPGKTPARRLAMIDAAGALAVPFTTGILIGIGETRAERIASLLAIRELHARHGHIQEVIVQNFLPKPGTKMAAHAAPDFDDLLWTAAVARLILPREISLQVPPNLSFDRFGDLLDAGINDWGGISPITPDHVNPEAAWPTVERLRIATARAGLDLAARTPVYPAWAADTARWIDPAVAPVLRRVSDGAGLLRQDSWFPGNAALDVPRYAPALTFAAPRIDALIARASTGERIDVSGIATLLQARGGAFEAVLAAADEARILQAGGDVTYVVNRNINYTNICAYRCGFCAFSKGKTHEHLRGKPYDLPLEEIGRRTAEAWKRGATEVCMQGGIHPRFTGRDYLAILATAKEAAPRIHVHAFSPLEVHHGASTLEMAESDYLAMLRDAGLGSLPGTAAEILTDRVRAQICPDKLTTGEWLRIIGAAHRVGLRTTATIMFGHVETHEDVAEHLLAIRDLQEETGGFTEFVPLPFVHAEAPMFLKGLTRKGPTFRETLLMHAVARLVLGPLIPNIQASWTKLGREGVARALAAGVNDLGGTLMNESISRAAGADHGQELPPADIEAIAAATGRTPRQRSTLYGIPDSGQQRRSYDAAPLAPLVLSRQPAFATGIA
uniref:5-amino-6-(D-ribitylamino)uracil--L-tyrosine 4-hydroxyphenyl transferase CofH n=1 Tax=Sphingomonas bacterium TaxID=1895847 RepID=UPI00260A9CFB|nr:5-amino-6-(D-ribitylamino)uracil--L-tyrosine 4-hydroxyphenyl transferase CofH [Sphingomonas bacterium]